MKFIINSDTSNVFEYGSKNYQNHLSLKMFEIEQFSLNIYDDMMQEFSPEEYRHHGIFKKVHAEGTQFNIVMEKCECYDIIYNHSKKMIRFLHSKDIETLTFINRSDNMKYVYHRNIISFDKDKKIYLYDVNSKILTIITSNEIIEKSVKLKQCIDDAYITNWRQCIDCILQDA